MTSLNHSITFIVDDDPFVGLLYKKHLSNLGYNNLHHFFSGVECLDNLHLNPDIVLLDHQMSEVNGFEVLKKIKRSNPNATVIMVSGQEDMATALNALKYGAFDYIIKDGTETEKIEEALKRLAMLKSQRPATKSLFRKLLP
ncbi:response regulator [Neolewinella aurantiaca]|uniref:Response regulator n=1 Tax=Neolewinella aurantiaca TaxID=2602767 RepID=A0A5C7FI56_9BACT|nr:response regulator [Neolewinella aurantiaca]TXF85974.1 response regulator [Neolewinella aurantiaca]